MGWGIVATALERALEIRVRPSSTGCWVEVPDPAEPVVVRSKPPPSLTPSDRVATLLIAGIAVFGGSLASFDSWVTRAIVVVLGLTLGVLALADYLPIPREDPAERFRAQWRFYALADPVRPLIDEDFALLSPGRTTQPARDALDDVRAPES